MSLQTGKGQMDVFAPDEKAVQAYSSRQAKDLH